MVEDATSPTFVVPDDGAGATYRVEVTATGEGYAPGVAFSAYSAKVTSGSCN